jgi:hypothetical protein
MVLPRLHPERTAVRGSCLARGPHRAATHPGPRRHRASARTAAALYTPTRSLSRQAFTQLSGLDPEQGVGACAFKGLDAGDVAAILPVLEARRLVGGWASIAETEGVASHQGRTLIGGVTLAHYGGGLRRQGARQRARSDGLPAPEEKNNEHDAHMDRRSRVRASDAGQRNRSPGTPRPSPPGAARN